MFGKGKSQYRICVWPTRIGIVILLLLMYEGRLVWSQGGSADIPIRTLTLLLPVMKEPSKLAVPSSLLCLTHQFPKTRKPRVEKCCRSHPLSHDTSRHADRNG